MSFGLNAVEIHTGGEASSVKVKMVFSKPVAFDQLPGDVKDLKVEGLARCLSRYLYSGDRCERVWLYRYFNT